MLVIAITSPIIFTLWLGFGNQFRAANNYGGYHKGSIPFERSIERPFICADPNRGYVVLDADLYCTPSEWFNEKFKYSGYYPYLITPFLIISAVASSIALAIYAYRKHRH